MTTRERMLAALRREPADHLVFAPRLDLWHTARAAAGTLPREHRDASVEEICRREGWGIFRLTGDYRYLSWSRDDWPFACLGLFNPPETIYSLGFSHEVEVVTEERGDEHHIEYRTAQGNLTASLQLTESMHRDGITYPMVLKRPVVTQDDLRAVACLFENLVVTPRPAGFLRSESDIGDLGVTVSQATDAASPMHQIQKYLLDPTVFFQYYRESPQILHALAESVAHYFRQVLDIYADSPVEVLEWGSNYDRTITFPPYFEKDILPWLRSVTDRLHQAGKLVLTHCDGENAGLMELIAASGVDGAESVCPYPMTSLKLHEYVEQWAATMAIIGGIPAEYLITDMHSHDALHAYLEYMLRAVAPGTGFIPAVTDAVSPLTQLDTLRRVADFLGERGALPLAVGPVADIFTSRQAVGGMPTGSTSTAEGTPDVEADPAFTEGPGLPVLAPVADALLSGDRANIGTHVAAALAAGVSAERILEQGMIATMERIGEAFARGELYIPEMLRAARTMEAGVEVLKAGLTDEGRALSTGGTVLLGTVFGDLHDIGKNLVGLMLRGVGYEVIDLGVNVAPETFADEVTLRRPGVVALSALLTTTMPQMRSVVETLEQRGLRNDVRVIVGGAPVTAEFGHHIGADGYAENAGGAGGLIQRLLTGRDGDSGLAPGQDRTQTTKGMDR